ncbi:MAG: DUF1571 domain-containing protein [Phycisphaerae bacterium]|jgi:hypothetical protein
MTKRLFRPTNRHVRVLVGVLVASLFCILCSRTEAFRQSHLLVAVAGQAVGENALSVQATVEKLARTDHVALLEYCLKNYEGRYHDYTCTLIKQEQINHVVGKEQQMDVKFLDAPFSVAMKWTPETAPVGDRVVYVEGKYGNQMLVRPKGMLGQLVGTVMRQPDGAEAMKNTLRPVNKFGFKNSLEALLTVYRQAQAAGELKEDFGGYAEVDGRKSIVLVRHLPPRDQYPSCKTVTFIDMEYLVPIAIEGYDWEQKLSSRYIFRNIKFNMGLTPSDFLPTANDMKMPK